MLLDRKLDAKEKKAKDFLALSVNMLGYIPIGSMYAIYGNIYHLYTPFMLAYIPAPWILWDLTCIFNDETDDFVHPWLTL